MVNYIIRRLLLVPVLLFGVTILIFLMMSFLQPVERLALYVRDFPKNENAIPALIRKYDFDKPIYVQYWNWLVGKVDQATGVRAGGVLFGKFGYSRSASQPVAELIQRRFPATLDLAIWTAAPMILVGIWLGVQAAVHHNGLIDQAARVFSIVGTSLPTFVFGLLLLMIFYANLHWFSPGRLSDDFNRVIESDAFHNYTSLLTFDALLNGRFDIFIDALRHMVMPILTLSYISWATFLRVTRFHARDLAHGIRHHRARQGTDGARCHPQTRQAQCHAPRDHAGGLQCGRPAGRGGHHRNGLQLSRHRIGLGARRHISRCGGHAGVCHVYRPDSDRGGACD